MTNRRDMLKLDGGLLAMAGPGVTAAPAAERPPAPPDPRTDRFRPVLTGASAEFSLLR